MFGITDDLLTRLGQERYDDPKVFMEPWEFNPNTVRAEYDFENLLYLCDLVGMCKFATQYNLPVTGISIEDMADLLKTVTGERFTGENLNLAARRVIMLERAYNAREGMRRIDDYPFFLRWKMERGEPHPIYKEDQVRVTAENYAAVLDEWYRLRGCDLKAGIPSGEELKKLGLEDVALDLEKRSIMP
jgi:aldehyde:ferredoxin oxidoreductase